MAYAVAIDFDGTIVQHKFPKIGAPVPGAFEWMKIFQERGLDLVLWTMRDYDYLDAAAAFCKENGIVFSGLNYHPNSRWSKSPKVDALCYIDDKSIGCPLIYPEDAKPYVDWSKVGPAVVALHESKLARKKNVPTEQPLA